jgi:hypothetical protein
MRKREGERDHNEASNKKYSSNKQYLSQAMDSR